MRFKLVIGKYRLFYWSINKIHPQCKITYNIAETITINWYISCTNLQTIGRFIMHTVDRLEVVAAFSTGAPLATKWLEMQSALPQNGCEELLGLAQH